MADENKGHGPVALPAGSIDAQLLHKELDKAVSVKNEDQHPERINQAIVNASSDLTKQVLANADKPAVPTGAKIVEQETVYVDGEDPVKTQGVAFLPAKGAESGAEAAKMRYVETGKGEVVATDEAIAAEPGDDQNAGPASLGELAAEDTGTASTAAKGRDK